MPREAAAKARENLRATINEDYLQDSDPFVFGVRRGARADKDGDYKRKSALSAGPSKRHRCGFCEGCHATNCGKCMYCLDMPQFGGRGNMRQSCIERKCKVIAAEDAKVKEEQRAEREAEREQKSAEREAEREARALERSARASGARSGSRQPLGNRDLAAVAKLTGFLLGANARLPSVRLEASIDGGWGQFDLPPDTRVEVRLPEEEQLGIMSGTIIDPATAPPLLPSPPKGGRKSSPRKGGAAAAAAAAEVAASAAADAASAEAEAAAAAGKLCIEFDELLNDDFPEEDKVRDCCTRIAL